jgi:hypothetical protein
MGGTNFYPPLAVNYAKKYTMKEKKSHKLGIGKKEFPTS